MITGLDLDGTLLDSRERHGAALVRAAQMEGVTLPADLPAGFVEEKSAGVTGAKVLAKYGVERARDVIARWVQIIEDDSLLDLDSLYPGVQAALRFRREHGDRFIIVTARQNQDSAVAQIRRLGLDAICDSVHVVDPRSHTGQLSAGVAKAKVTEAMSLSLVIGDTETDEEWARILRVPFAAVTCGFRNRKFWLARGVDPSEDLVAALLNRTVES